MLRPRPQANGQSKSRSEHVRPCKKTSTTGRRLGPSNSQPLTRNVPNSNKQSRKKSEIRCDHHHLAADGQERQEKDDSFNVITIDELQKILGLAQNGPGRPKDRPKPKTTTTVVPATPPPARTISSPIGKEVTPAALGLLQSVPSSGRTFEKTSLRISNDGIFFPFGSSGGGAPLRTDSGHLLTEYKARRGGLATVLSGELAGVETTQRPAPLLPPAAKEKEPRRSAFGQEQVTPYRSIRTVPRAMRSSLTFGTSLASMEDTAAADRQQWLQHLENQVEEKRQRRQTWGHRVDASSSYFEPREMASASTGQPVQQNGRLGSSLSFGGSTAADTSPVDTRKWQFNREQQLREAQVQRDMAFVEKTPGQLPVVDARARVNSQQPSDTSPEEKGSFHRNHRLLLDPGVLTEIGKKKQKDLEHHVFIRQQIEQKQRLKEEEQKRASRRREEEEARLARERAELHDRWLKEKEAATKKEEDARRRAEHLQNQVEIARQAALQEKRGRLERHVRKGLETIQEDKTVSKDPELPSTGKVVSLSAGRRLFTEEEDQIPNYVNTLTISPSPVHRINVDIQPPPREKAASRTQMSHQTDDSKPKPKPNSKLNSNEKRGDGKRNQSVNLRYGQARQTKERTKADAGPSLRPPKVRNPNREGDKKPKSKAKQEKSFSQQQQRQLAAAAAAANKSSGQHEVVNDHDFAKEFSEKYSAAALRSRPAPVMTQEDVRDSESPSSDALAIPVHRTDSISLLPELGVGGHGRREAEGKPSLRELQRAKPLPSTASQVLRQTRQYLESKRQPQAGLWMDGKTMRGDEIGVAENSQDSNRREQILTQIAFLRQGLLNKERQLQEILH
eukprot:m.8588 g.8588  ORF g.8588 m.8588 type:complete len:847 (+) comp20722_c0_seq1:49-2589(+)